MHWRKRQLEALASGNIQIPEATMLDAVIAQAADPGPKWIHIATSGTYRGHKKGPFELTQQSFDSIITNLRADPRFKLGTDGLGNADVIPFDYEHASEMNPTQGMIPMGGTPAPAWAMDMKTETVDGKVKLYALTNLGQLIKGQISRNEYKFVSMAVHPNWVSQITGQDVGHTITSIAFTNTPFVQDLEPIAASARAALKLSYDGDLGYYHKADNAQEAVESLQKLVARNGGVQAIDQTIASVMGLIEAPPEGSNSEEVLTVLRSILHLEPTADSAAVSEALGKVQAQLIQPQPGSTVAQPVETTAPSSAIENSATNKETTMPLSVFATKIAAKFLTNKTLLSSATLLATDEDVESAVDEVVTKANSSDEILAALGVGDPASAMAGLVELQSAKAKLQEVMAELDAALAVVQQVEGAQADSDVAAALSSKGLDVSCTVALVAHRAILCKVDTDSDVDPVEQKKAGRVKFLEHYAVPEGEHAKLLSLIVADGAKEQTPAARVKEDSDLEKNIPEGAIVLELTASHRQEAKSLYGDGNNSLAAIVCLSAKDESFASLDYHQKLRQLSGRVASQSVVITEPSPA